MTNNIIQEAQRKCCGNLLGSEMSEASGKTPCQASICNSTVKKDMNSTWRTGGGA